MIILYILIYNIIIYVVQPIIWIRLIWRSRRISLYRYNLLERYGLYNKKYIKPNDIILHAVSIGETLSTISLIQTLHKHYPNTTITLTTMTPSGLELARRLQCNNNYVQCIYLPYDLPGSMKRFINHIQPKLVIIMETEIWPNLINILYKRNIPIIIANARLSFQSFIKYKKLNNFISLIMKRITIIAAQHTEDANRFVKLGLKKNQIFITGNLKFDITITQDLANKILFLKKNWIKGRLTWIASSTHAGEEILLLQAHKKLLTIFPNLLMILAPRHPERFINVKNIIDKIGFSYIMKSNGTTPIQTTQIIINDTVGELMLLYGISDIAFVGGSLVYHGGHNPLEPAAHSIPIIMGPHTFNFNQICSKLQKSGGLINVTDVTSLIQTISMLLSNKKNRIHYGNQAFKVFIHNQGALKRLINIIHNYLPK